VFHDEGVANVMIRPIEAPDIEPVAKLLSELAKDFITGEFEATAQKSLPRGEQRRGNPRFPDASGNPTKGSTLWSIGPADLRDSEFR